MGFIKKFGITIAFSLLLLAGSGPVLADNYGTDATVNATGGLLPKTVAGAGNVEGVIGKVISIILSMFGIVFFLLIFYAGFQWMTAQGNSDKVEKAKETILAAAIGLIIVLAAYAITNFVFTNLVPAASTTPIP